MSKRGGGYRAPGNYDPRRGNAKSSKKNASRFSGFRADDTSSGKSSTPGRPRAAGAGGRDGGDPSRRQAAAKQIAAAQPEIGLPALPDPPQAKLDARITRPEDVAGIGFGQLGLGENIVRALGELGAESPFAIQAATIPDALAGHHVLGRGRTGSGKTIAFGAALVERLLRLKAEGAFPTDAPKAKPQRGERQAGERRADRREKPAQARAPRRPKALILAPTRELALQIDRTVQPIARSVGLFTGQFVGGQPFEPQLHALQRGVDIAIGTPGRVEDLAKRGHLGLGQVAVTVIDEADHLAELGFIEPVQRILRMTRRGGQRLLFSATLDGRVQSLVDEFMPRPAIHEVVGGEGAASDDGRTVNLPEKVEHRVLIVLREHKDAALVQLARDGFDGSGAGRTIVFCRTRAYAEHVAEMLSDAGLKALPLHGDLSQSRRERNLEKFADGKADILVATDVAARGIHVDDVELVLQADPPDDTKAYVHRAGRTGRVGKGGRVLTVIPRTRQKCTRELFAQLGVEPASFADFVPGSP
ncbi:MAG: DEAD/DEAH box helicase [Actinobacteria bacterium]|nr:DEAD/DEAH box helicase [Actinomycetota bacterium]